jgi:hypothetical protein
MSTAYIVIFCLGAFAFFGALFYGAISAIPVRWKK